MGRVSEPRACSLIVDLQILPEGPAGEIVGRLFPGYFINLVLADLVLAAHVVKNIPQEVLSHVAFSNY